MCSMTMTMTFVDDEVQLIKSHMNMKPRHLHRQLLQQKQRRRHGNNPQRRERRAGFHRSMAAAILVLATTLSSLPMTSATAHPTTYSYSSPPTSTVPQHQCLIPDDDNACISSSSASLMLQSSSICHDERRHNRHSYPRVGTPTLSLSTQCLNTTIHHCRGGSRSADNANDHQQTEEEDQGTSENSDKSSSTLSHHHRKYYFPPKAITTRLVIEFDTHAIMSGSSSSGGGVFQRRGTTSLRNRIGNRIGGTDDANNYWRRRRHLSTHTHANRQFPSLSISFDVNPATTTPSSSATTVIEGGNSTAAWHESNNTFRNDDKSSQEEQQQQYRSCSNNAVPVRPLLLAPTILTLLTQTATLLPPLILARRTLNMTWTAIVDYFRGRTIRTTFTKMERAYLRYYEFPAVTRAMARIGSQIGILLSLSWGVRLWMIWVCSSSGSGSSSDVSWPTSMVLGVTGFDAMRSSVGMSSSSSSILLGPGLKVGLPCHQRGKGIAWLCGFIWIGAVVGIGHACAMALSVWGGPLRLQATAQHAESPKMFLRRIVHHPIIWLRELEEWKYYSSLDPFHKADGNNKRDGTFNPDPLLFPATWLPLRWLQIFALAKAFSTNPLNYRWCSQECGKDIIPRLMKQYLVQLALGDEWHRVFLGEKRIGLGIMVVVSYFIALVWMVVTTFTLDGGAAAMLIPSVLAAIISVVMNFMIFWNRLGTREQRKALNAMGLA